jgi:hypothetical protein
MICGSLFKQPPPVSYFMDGRGKGKVEFERRKEVLVPKDGSVGLLLMEIFQNS